MYKKNRNVPVLPMN